MSERRDSTCQKHELPKSLQGTEDAEFVWSMIIDRFPNAAPLLCEMEAVIDRAEDLLQQLRTPCREIETSTSFCSPDSEDSTVMISARESIFTDIDTAEENNAGKNVAEIQVSQSTMCEEDVNVNGQRSDFKEQDTRTQSSDSLMIFHPTEEKFPVVESPTKVETDTDQMTKHARSLEEWGKAVDNALRGSILGKEQIRKETTVVEKKRVDEIKTEDDRQSSCIILHRQEKYADVEGSVVLVDSELSRKTEESREKSVNATTKMNTTGSGDEGTSNQRTPLNILEAYSKRCGVPITYEFITDGPHRHKSNVFVIRGSLGGFTATSRGQTEESTKNDLASKILQMIANRQMKDEKLITLAKLSKEEMMEVINLGMDSPRETAQRKLYQLCLERGQELPKYCVDKRETCEGLSCIATCTALGYIGEGRGVRECVAKRAAADDLYHQYCQDTKAASK
ncbi:uncharacterized protein LOC100881261 isoform X2 [Megachile rotundata]|nr:PREDICTED: uncharacterized protein LOC100881261 isoform X2 [Megachile rotundata]